MPTIWSSRHCEAGSQHPSPAHQVALQWPEAAVVAHTSCAHPKDVAGPAADLDLKPWGQAGARQGPGRGLSDFLACSPATYSALALLSFWPLAPLLGQVSSCEYWKERKVCLWLRSSQSEEPQEPPKYYDWYQKESPGVFSSFLGFNFSLLASGWLPGGSNWQKT